MNYFENISLTSQIPGNNQSTKVSIFDKILIGVACIIVICLTLIGNSLVVSVIIRFKRLKNATNYILLSLAIADITVTFLVMIPAMIQDVIQKWIFNELFCKFYNSFDITCCTASILHLLLVAIDRYIAIFKPLAYKNLVRKWHVFVGVLFVWTLSLCMSFIPIFLGLNLKDPFDERVPMGPNDTCILEANTTYAIISSSLSFFIPLIIMTCVYLRIFIVARQQAIAIAQIDLRAKNLSSQMNNSNLLNSQNTESTNALNNTELLNDSTINKLLNESEETKCLDDKIDKKNRFVRLLKQIKLIEKKRSTDTKAIKTLGIIMGIFILCWLPFFIMYVSISLTNHPFPLIAERLITWIGYVNSFINPIIYALTNKDFRKSYISTLKSLSKKFCPFSIHKSIFGYNEDYFSASSNLKSNKKIQSKNDDINQNRICKCVARSSNASQNSTSKENHNNLIPELNLDEIKNKKMSLCSKDGHLSDISENEHSNLFNDLNNNLIIITNNHEKAIDISSPSDKVFEFDEITPEKINRNSILKTKSTNICEQNNLIVKMNLKSDKKSTGSTAPKLIRNFSLRTYTKEKPKKPRERCLSNDIILIRI